MIKVRHTVNKDALCCECGANKDEVLNMFDFCIGENIFHICNFCNEKLSERSNHVLCFVNRRVKTRREISVINLYKKKYKNNEN